MLLLWKQIYCGILVTVIVTLYLCTVTTVTDMETLIKEKKKVTDYDATSESPYNVELYSKYIQADPEHHVAIIDGKECGWYQMPKGKTRITDNAQYTKMFRGNGPLLMGMSEPATRMFYYILDHIAVHKDEVCILQEDYLKFAGYKDKSRLTYYRAVEGLLKANVIARRTGMQSCYWVNPNIIFNGDRTKLKNITVRPPDKASFSFDNKE